MGAGAGQAPPLPVVVVQSDNVRITESSLIRIPPGLVVADGDDDGVIHIDADGVVVEFERDSVLRGCTPGTDPEAMTGIGVRIAGRRGVVVRGAAVSGYKVGLLATDAPGLLIEGGRFDDNFRQRLYSTPTAEDGRDWLWPHRNDEGEWRRQYGAAVCIERSEGIEIHGVIVRRGQNGIILDRVHGGRVCDNDASFLSGWGLAMWRSRGNLIARNAFDFCIRGYSHGVYNRGQDSAGILMFEQCSGNVIVENSATHSGDGLFAFAGREAIGEAPPPTPDFDYRRLGCNDNIIVGNDFSYAAAHGLEMTFSHGNVIASNRFVENAICGIWGGYSQNMLIAGNTFERNGQAGYGLERGGVNIEHGSGNRIVGNTFREDRCGVHLWWDDDDALLSRPGVVANYRGVADNIIAENEFATVPVVLHLRDLSPGRDQVRGTVFTANVRRDCGLDVDATAGVGVVTDGPVPAWHVPHVHAPGRARPVGARAALRGRHNVIMGPWGPWDHAEPMVRRAWTGAGRREGNWQPMIRTYEIFGGAGVWSYEDLLTGGRGEWPVPPTSDRPLTLTVVARQDVQPYAYRIRNDGWVTEVRGVLVSARWSARFFTWTEASDPRQDLAGWRALANAPDAVEISDLPGLHMVYGHGGPGDQPWAGERRVRLPGSDRFGMIATARLVLPPGRWTFATRSDDGVRVIVNGQTVIENWTWHGPTRDTGLYEQPAEGPVEVVVEHFEIDGYAVLELEIEPVGPDS